MAAAVYATDLTTFWLEGATTVTAIGTGGAGLGNPETDFFIQGSDCISKAAWTNAIKGFIIDALGTTFTVPTDGCVIAFAKYDAAGSLDTKAGGGLRMIIGSGSAAYDEFFVGGSDTLAFDSWYPYAIDPNTATPDVSGSGGTERWVGLLADLPTTSGPTKGNPIAMDAIRYGRGRIDYTNGDLGNGYATFAGAETFGNDSTRRWGLLELQNGAYQTQGFHSIGTAGTSCDFRDSNKVLFWRDMNNNVSNDAVSTAFNRVEIINASTNCDWDNIIWQALGTRSRGTFVHTAGTFDATNCQFIDWDTFTLLAASVATDCVFRRCNAITAPGSNLSGSQILTPTVAADTSGLIWNVATDPSGKLDDMTFSKGTNAHHAIEFGTSSPTTINLAGITFTGFNTSTNGQNDSTFHILRTSGTVTINISGSGTTATNLTYKSAGATVVIQQNVSVTFTGLKDNTEVRVYNDSTGVELAGVENATDGTADNRSFTASISAGTTVRYIIHNVQYEYIQVNGFTWPSANQSLAIQQRFDRNFSNPV